MRVLVVGSGGREHALAWKLAQTCEVFCVPGNPGIGEVATLRDGSIVDPDQLEAICREDKIDLVVFGPERPLIAGMADYLRAKGYAVFGPSAVCAQIEGSKSFAKKLMIERGIPTAKYRDFSEFNEARDYINSEYAAGREVVVKASGEALGKGVVVPEDKAEAVSAAKSMLVDRSLGDAGRLIVVEERLVGREVSLIAICNGLDYLVLPSAKDYKSAFDGGFGPNTGGMGAISPSPDVEEGEFQSWAETFIRPILVSFAEAGKRYIGTLYAGLILTEEGPKALEYNARFGDPETQAIMPRINGDLGEILCLAAEGKPMPSLEVGPECSATIVLSARGYPGKYEKDIPLPEIKSSEKVIIFHAGTSVVGGQVVSAGGRVLNVTGLALESQEAVELAYGAIDGRFDERWHYRKDIGR